MSLPLAAFPLAARTGSAAPFVLAVLIGLGIYLAHQEKQQQPAKSTR